eukprot:EG_transcript_16739
MLQRLIFLLCGAAAVQSAENDGQGIILTITPEKGGLGTQLFGLAHSLLVATTMGWDYELPEFLYHTSDQVLHRGSISRILDVEFMQAVFREQGTTLYAHGATGPTHTVRLQNPPISRPLWEWIQRATDTAETALAQTNLSVKVVHSNPGARDISIRRADWRAMRELVGNLHFALDLVSIADDIVDDLELRYAHFNAVHLLIEEDFKQHFALKDEAFHVSPCLYGSISCLYHVYFPVFREENSSAPYYVACSTLSVPLENKDDVLEHLQQLAPVWHYGTQYLTPEQGQGLVYEQLAVVDLLVLAHSDFFVGMSWSPFTRFTMVYRASRGRRGRDRFVDVTPAEGGL